MPRPAKTEAEHWLTNTVSQVGRSQPGKTESVYVAGRPRIPAHLDKIARAEFKRLCFELEQRQTLTSGDRLTISVLAECYSRWLTAKRELGSEFSIKTTVLDSNGSPVPVVKPNPLVRVVEVCEARILSLSKSLGLTPADRDKIKRAKAEAEPVEETTYDAWAAKNNVVPISKPEIAPEEMADEPTEEKENAS
jgi:P27 family predicted phage terminase small subunit